MTEMFLKGPLRKVAQCYICFKKFPITHHTPKKCCSDECKAKFDQYHRSNKKEKDE